MKVILFANTDWYLFNFRLPLLRALREAGYEVVLISPPGGYGPRLEAEGFRWLPFPLERRGMNPWVELKTIFSLARVYRTERPDVVHHFTIKCVLYGSLAARLAGVRKIINAITGLGYIFTPARRAQWLRLLLQPVYRLALRNTAVIFQNPDDIALFRQQRLLGKAHVHLIRGSGVDTDVFVPSPEPAGDPVVMMVGRFLWDKGVGEFVEAARSLKRSLSLSKGTAAQGTTARFVLVGDTYPDNPRAVPPDQLQAWVGDGVVEWWGWHDDMRVMLPQAHIVCLPSYREGMPLSLAEAGACARPVVTTDAPGCREIAQDGVNGFLVPVRDADALAKALLKFIRDPALRQEMGRRGRSLAEAEFSVRRIVAETLQVYNEMVPISAGVDSV
jgi:glycosyltransferase involved in cell wall biosynthesis